MAVGLCNIKNLQKNIWKTVSYRKLNKLSAHVEKPPRDVCTTVSTKRPWSLMEPQNNLLYVHQGPC